MIALRLNFTDVIRDGSMKHIYANGKKVGTSFDVKLSYYRGMFLSAINELRVVIDGEEIAQDSTFISVKGHDYGMAQIGTCGNIFWPVAEPATIKIFKAGGYEAGEHDIEFIMFFRSPYMEIGPDFYMPNDGGDHKTLTLA